MKLGVVHGDLLAQDVEVLVNAWNRNIIPWWLLIPQGVSRALRKSAGTQPFREVFRAGTIPVGGAVKTSAGALPHRAIIHVAGINLSWRSTERSVRDATRNAVELARDEGFSSIALPLIGAGTGGGGEARVLELMQDELRAVEFEGEVRIVVYERSAPGFRPPEAPLEASDPGEEAQPSRLLAFVVASVIALISSMLLGLLEGVRLASVNETFGVVARLVPSILVPSGLDTGTRMAAVAVAFGVAAASDRSPDVLTRPSFPEWVRGTVLRALPFALLFSVPSFVAAAAFWVALETAIPVDAWWKAVEWLQATDGATLAGTLLVFGAVLSLALPPWLRWVGRKDWQAPLRYFLLWMVFGNAFALLGGLREVLL